MIPENFFIQAFNPAEPEVFRQVDPTPWKVQFLETSQIVTDLYDASTFMKEYNLLSPYAIGGNFWDIIKNQVHIFPSLKQDFGLVLSQQEVDYYVWNAYTDKMVTVREISTTGDFGATLTLDIAGEFTLDAGKGVPGVLTVYIEGPVSALTEVVIGVRVTGDPADIQYTVVATCTRIIIFPFNVDWSTEPVMTYKYATVITTNLRSVEQRRPLFESPNRSVSFMAFDSMRGLTPNAINFAADKNVGAPVPYELFHIASLSTDKFTMTSVEDLTYYWNLKKCSRYVGFLNEKTRKIIAKEIDVISGNNITFVTPFLETYEDLANYTAFPLFIGVFKTVETKTISPNHSTFTITFDELIGENQPDFGTIPALPSKFPFKEDWSKDIGFEFPLWRDIVGTTGTAQYLYSKEPKDKNQPRTITATYTLQSKKEISDFLDFMSAAKGRLKSFLFKVPVNAFCVVMPEYPGTQRLRVETNFFAEAYSKVLNKGVTIKYRNYSVDANIVGASSGTTFSTIFLDTVLPFQIFEEDMDSLRVEVWSKVRFDLDEFKVTSKTLSTAQVTLKFKEVL